MIAHRQLLCAAEPERLKSKKHMWVSYRVLRKERRAARQQRSDEEHPKRGTHRQWSWVMSHREVLA